MFAKWDVTTGFGIDVFFSESKIDDVYHMLFARRRTTDEKVLGFDTLSKEKQFSSFRKTNQH